MAGEEGDLLKSIGQFKEPRTKERVHSEWTISLTFDTLSKKKMYYKTFYNVFSDREVQKVYSSLTPATTEIDLYHDQSLPLTPFLQVIWLHIESHFFWRLLEFAVKHANSQCNNETAHEDHAFRHFGSNLNIGTLKVFFIPNITYGLLLALKKFDFFLFLNNGKSNGC